MEGTTGLHRSPLARGRLLPRYLYGCLLANELFVTSVTTLSDHRSVRTFKVELKREDVMACGPASRPFILICEMCTVSRSAREAGSKVI